MHERGALVNALTVVLVVLTTARITRLITTDVLFEEPRSWLTRAVLRGNPDGVLRNKIAYLIVCQWCASTYVGAAVAGAGWAWGGTMFFMVITAALAASYVTGFLASLKEG